jgi:hypothetical protein
MLGSHVFFDLLCVDSELLKLFEGVGMGLLVLGALLFFLGLRDLSVRSLLGQRIDLSLQTVDFGLLTAQLDTTNLHDLVLQGLDLSFDVRCLSIELGYLRFHRRNALFQS